jgi:hypothetical protein
MMGEACYDAIRITTQKPVNLSVSLQGSTEGEFNSILASSHGLLNDFMRPVQHRLRNRHPDLLCSLKIDDQLKLGRLLDGQNGKLGSLEGFVHVDGDAPVGVRGVRPA